MADAGNIVTPILSDSRFVSKYVEANLESFRNTYNTCLRPVPEGFVFKMQEGVSEKGSQILRPKGRGISRTVRTSLDIVTTNTSRTGLNQDNNMTFSISPRKCY